MLKAIAALEAFLLSFGAWGLMAIAFLDSAFLPVPEAVDLWVITLCILNPKAMLLYAAVTTVSSVAGCLMLYYLARRGGHGAAERRVGKERMTRIRNWFEKYELLTIMVPAILPPPLPFKAFVITAGVLEVHVGKFLLAVVIGRTIRYFAEAFLAVHFGVAVRHFLAAKGALLAIAAAVILVAAWVVIRLVTRQDLRPAAISEGSKQ